MSSPARKIGIAIVSYRSADVIEDCLRSLAALKGVEPRIVVVDNASDDASVDVIRAWAAAMAGRVDFAEADFDSMAPPERWLTLLRAPVNRGFAYGTNRALEMLLRDRSLDHFWLLNPDARALPDCAEHLLRTAGEGRYAMIGGRVLFAAHPDVVQTDGGRVSRLTGTCVSVNWGRSLGEARMPAAGTLDFITGAHCLVSRSFLERVGLMRDDYFLYYEEVDWALRRGDLPLRVAPGAVIQHHGGTAIGTGSIGRQPSPFSNYFNYRNRMRLLARFSPLGLPFGLFYGLAKAAQLVAKGYRAEAAAAIAGMFQLPPPRAVRELLPPGAQVHAFGSGQ